MSNQELLERSRRGELTPAEQRDLFQRALQDPALFHAMAVDGLIEESLESPAFRAKWLGARRSPVWYWAIGAAAAAAALLLFLRPPTPAVVTPQRAPVNAVAATPALPPVLNAAGESGAPVLLALRLAPPGGSAMAFRGAADAERLPRRAGRVDSAGIEVSVDLGSSDGVSPGTELTILRDGRDVGTVKVVTVFGERSRGELIRGTGIQAGDEVRLPAKLHLDALWEASEALSARRDLAGAVRAASAALAAAPAEWKALALERLAEAEYRAGRAEDARRRFADAVAAPRAAPSAWESYGVLSLLAGDAVAAERAFRQAGLLTQKDAAAQARALNNLAVLAETRGDRATALNLYTKALALLAPGPQHEAMRKNLARVQEAR